MRIAGWWKLRCNVDKDNQQLKSVFTRRHGGHSDIPKPRGILNTTLRGPTPYPFIYHFSRKRYPFCIRLIDKWYPFHIPCLDLCIPVNLYLRRPCMLVYQSNRLWAELFPQINVCITAVEWKRSHISLSPSPRLRGQSYHCADILGYLGSSLVGGTNYLSHALVVTIVTTLSTDHWFQDVL